MLSSKKLGLLLLKKNIFHFNFGAIFLPCPGDKEPCWKFSVTTVVYGGEYLNSLLSKQNAAIIIIIFPGYH